MFPDGQKLVTIHDPIRSGSQPDDVDLPGEILVEPGEIELTPGRLGVAFAYPTSAIVRSRWDPIFISSRSIVHSGFDRPQALGMRLDIAAGTSVRFEPGEERDVDLVALGGTRNIHGLNRLTSGLVDDEAVRDSALARIDALGYGDLASGDA